jgi:hypothetical protein
MINKEHKMKPTQNELTNWAIGRIQKDFKDDVALLIAVPGHSLDDDCHGECFNYFVPANEKGNRLAQTFIIDGVGHDLYPRSWKRIENMAQFDDNYIYGLAEANILYSRSDEDRKRFAEFQEKQRANMEDRDFMFRKALEKLDAAMDLYRTVMFEDALYKVRMAAGFIARDLAFAVACVNGTYFKKPLDLETVELAQMKDTPQNFIGISLAIVKAKSVDELKKLSQEIIGATRKFMAARSPGKAEKTKPPIYEDLASWYQELSLMWRRIYRHCDTRQFERVFVDAISLQSELNIVEKEYGLRQMDLLGCYDTENLKPFKDRAGELERYIVSEIENHGVSLNKYDTIGDFLAKNGR